MNDQRQEDVLAKMRTKVRASDPNMTRIVAQLALRIERHECSLSSMVDALWDAAALGYVLGCRDQNNEAAIRLRKVMR